MAHHVPSLSDTKITLGGFGQKVFTISAIIGVVGLAATVGLGAAEGDGFRHFGYSYLVNFAFFLSISLGALIFMPIMYLTRSSWSIVVRRLMEVVAAVLPLMAVMAIPVILLASQVYDWATPGTLESHGMGHKAVFLSMPWFIFRWVLYFVVWTSVSWFFWRNSVKQDADGDLKVLRDDINEIGLSLLVNRHSSLLGFINAD